VATDGAQAIFFRKILNTNHNISHGLYRIHKTAFNLVEEQQANKKHNQHKASAVKQAIDTNCACRTILPNLDESFTILVSQVFC